MTPPTQTTGAMLPLRLALRQPTALHLALRTALHNCTAQRTDARCTVKVMRDVDLDQDGSITCVFFCSVLSPSLAWELQPFAFLSVTTKKNLSGLTKYM